MLRRPVVCVLAGLLSCATACSGSHRANTTGTPSPHNGTISGLLAAYGAATNAQVVPLPGTVTASLGVQVYTVQVGRDGKYEFHLPPGTYMLRGTSPKFNHGAVDACHATGPVVVIADQTINAGVLCLAQR